MWHQQEEYNKAYKSGRQTDKQVLQLLF